MKNKKLSKSISDAGWSQFFTYLTYKSEWEYKVIQKVDRYFPSSKKCSACGEIYKDLKLQDREWACTSCGVIHDRDKNASTLHNGRRVEIRLEKASPLAYRAFDCEAFKKSSLYGSL